MRQAAAPNVLGVRVDAIDYAGAVERIVAAARAGRPFAATALAAHGIMTGVRDPEQQYRLNHLDLVAPDGQPVRWALHLLHGARLPDRVYGPRLTLELCRTAAREGLPVYFYGSRKFVLDRMVANLSARCPGLIVAGAEPSRFRRTSDEEARALVARIRSSGARMVFVGLGCPRQEVFAYEYRDALRIPLVAVGAAFDYHAGLVSEPPAFIQRAGLQWAYRLMQEPRRLWRRYLVLGPPFAALVLLQRLGVWQASPWGIKPHAQLRPG